MPTSVIAAAAPAVISGGLSFLGSKLFGGGKPAAPPPPTGINAGGLTSTLSGGNIGINASPERLGLVSGVSDAFGRLGSDLGILRQSVAPGISGLRASRLQEIENARQRAIGDLRENLQRRRVLGSSFGSDAIARAESEFGGQRDKVAAESFLQELELTNQFITQQFNAQRGQFQTGLDELNLQADVATKLASKATDTLSANARFTSALAAQEAQNAGKFFGQSFGPAFNAIGQSVGGGIGNLAQFGSAAGSGFGGSGFPLAA